MKRTVFLLCAVLCACSDGKEPQEYAEAPDGTVFTANFIQAYVVPERLMGEATPDGYLHLAFEGRTIRNTDAAVQDAYAALSAKFNDNSYDGYLVPHSTEALGVDCSAIDVVCDKAYDETHEAGVSLGDVVKVCAVSFHDYIAEEYKSASGSEPFPAEFAGLELYNGLGAAPLFKVLKGLQPEDLKLIGPEIYLYFPKAPEAGSYRFTVTVRMETGEMSTEIPVKFD